MTSLGYPFMAKGVAVTGLARGYAAHLYPLRGFENAMMHVGSVQATLEDPYRSIRADRGEQ